MASRAQRREERKIEALVQGIGLLALLAFLGFGGLSGVALLPALLLFGFVVLLCVGVCVVVWRSRLIRGKRIGICACMFGALVVGIWSIIKAPPMWVEQQGTITAISAPPGTVETDYVFRSSAGNGTITLSKESASSAEARKAKPGSVTLYVNPQNPAQASERATAGWTRTQATPVAVRVKERGTYKTRMRFGQLFSVKTVEFEGPSQPAFAVGAHLPVYLDPVSRDKISLTPQPTEGGQRYGLLGFGLALLAGGIGFIVSDKRWRSSEVQPPMCVTPSPAAASQARPLNAQEQLTRIDWRQFERVAARILEHMEWQVTLSGGAKPDGGSDIIARKNGEIAVVQCKHWRNTQVQVKVVRELLGTKASAGFAAHEAVLFTSSSLTDDALRFSRENKITVFDGAAIIRLVEEIGVVNFPELVDPDRKLCPKCDAPMVRRDAARPFWGCSTFPRCRGVIEIGA
mgnify:CR=1 FL=1